MTKLPEMSRGAVIPHGDSDIEISMPPSFCNSFIGYLSLYNLLVFSSEASCSLFVYKRIVIQAISTSVLLMVLVGFFFFHSFSISILQADSTIVWLASRFDHRTEHNHVYCNGNIYVWLTWPAVSSVVASHLLWRKQTSWMGSPVFRIVIVWITFIIQSYLSISSVNSKVGSKLHWTNLKICVQKSMYYIYVLHFLDVYETKMSL